MAENYLKIKQLVVETNKNGKLLARLPNDYWEDQNKELLHKTLHKLESITVDDIHIESVEEYPKYNRTVYTLSIHKFLRYSLIEHENGDVGFEQLAFKNK